MTESADYFAPEGLRTRGTVIVVPGRGETPVCVNSAQDVNFYNPPAKASDDDVRGAVRR